MAEATIGLEVSRGHLVELECDGTVYWMTKEHHETADPDLPAACRSVLALPGFDEYLLGYQERSLVLPAEHAQRIVPGNSGIFLPMIVTGGPIVGTWRRSSSRATVRSNQFCSPPRRHGEASGFAASVRAYGRFLGMKAIVEVGPSLEPRSPRKTVQKRTAIDCRR